MKWPTKPRLNSECAPQIVRVALLYLCCTIFGHTTGLAQAEPHPNSDSLLRTGIAFAQKGQFLEAGRTFARCVQDDPALFECHYNLALAELAQNHLSQAYAVIEAAPHATEEDSTARIYLKGKIEAAMGRTEIAEQDLRAAFEKQPAQENFALDLGLVYLEAHAYQDSEKIFAQASSLNPQSTYLLLGLALSQFQSAHKTECVDSSKRLIALAPDFSPARLLLGFAYYFDSDFTGAIDTAQKGLKLQDPDPFLYYLEAAAMLKQHSGGHAQILGDLTAAEKGIPNCGLCYVDSGKVHEQQNDLPAALADLQKAVSLAPELSEGWYHLASVYARLGNSAQAAKARKHFQAMKANQDEREKEMMRQMLMRSLGSQGGGAR